MTAEEQRLVRWMLEHGRPEAKSFLSQLDAVMVTAWRCPCGCASINFALKGQPDPTGVMHPIADFMFGGDEVLSGVFVYEQDGVLGGVEVYGLAGDAPKRLPSPELLQPFEGNAAPVPSTR